MNGKQKRLDKKWLWPKAMFSELRGRVAEWLKNLGAQDEHDKAIAAMVERGTSEELLGPDMEVNKQLVDLVNRDPKSVAGRSAGKA
jgi:hypothetical protein